MGKRRSWQLLEQEECREGSRRRCSRVLATTAALHLHDHVFWRRTYCRWHRNGGGGGVKELGQRLLKDSDAGIDGGKDIVGNRA